MLSLKYKLLLGSQSPRRRDILRQAGFQFRTIAIDYDEKYGADIIGADIPLYLAEQKALHAPPLAEDELLLTADTLVFQDGRPLGKPADRAAAFDMLQSLSGRCHEVITGVCLLQGNRKLLFSDTSKVCFKLFDLKESAYYIDNFSVLDKAGAYGVQDWLGLIGITRIEGSFYNVMGLPMHLVYDKLKLFAND